MKHIKKKFLKYSPSETSTGMEELPIDYTKKVGLSEVKNIKDFISIIENDQKELFVGFIHKENKENYIVNLPIIPMVFFDNAYHHNLNSKIYKKKIFDELRPDSKNLSSFAEHEIYKYIGYTTSSVIMMCAALESFANEIISSKNYIYVNDLKNKTESYNAYQIQQNIDIKTKLFEILPLAKNIRIDKNSLFVQGVHRLIEFRNEMVHLKSVPNSMDYVQNRIEMMRKLLNFDYDKSLFFVRKYINHFSPDYLMDCDCEYDF